MQKLQSQGVHHITINGANRQTSIDFWEGVLGMPFVFEQPNLDRNSESHLYFDPGDGRLITIFTDESRKADPRRTPNEPGCVHHIAFNVSRVTFLQAVKRLDDRGIKHSGVKDRGFMEFDLLHRSARAIDRTRLVPLRAAAGVHPCRRAARSPQDPGRSGRSEYRGSSPRRRHRGDDRGAHEDSVARPQAEKSVLITAIAITGGKHGRHQSSRHQAERQQHDGARVRARRQARLSPRTTPTARPANRPSSPRTRRT